MRQSSSPSTPPSSASRSPYASFFNIFDCGCASDAEESALAQEQRQQSLVVHEEDDYDGDEEVESAKEYLERVKEKLPIHEENNRRERRQDSCSPEPHRPMMQAPKIRFEIATPPSSESYGCIKHTDSESTQSTQSMSDMDSDLDDESREGYEGFRKNPVSILRRREKLGSLEIAPSGAAVQFAPCTVFPDPNVPQRRRKVRRLTKQERSALRRYQEACLKPHLSPILVVKTCANYDELTESPSNDILIPGSDVYVFR